MAKRVLPIPPGPTTVSSRHCGSLSNSPSAANSDSRPIKGVAGTGRLKRATGGSCSTMGAGEGGPSRSTGS